MPLTLRPDTLLHGSTYRIVRFLSSGGFGCTYEAEHVLLRKRVAIKEFFVKDYCNRDSTTAHVTVGTETKRGLVERLRSKFLDEARTLATLSHRGIVRVTDVFEENATAYFVMDFVDGRTLADIVKEEGALSEVRAVGYIRQVCEALAYVHEHKCLHLDIKPGNIIIDSADKPVLIDFGAAKQYDEIGGENTSTLLGKTPGYAPLEQMGNKVGNFLPATDIYALGATLYKLLTGVTPPDATLISSGEEELPPPPASVSRATRAAVEAAMQSRKAARPQSVAAFVALLDGASDSGNSTSDDTDGAVDDENTIIDEQASTPKPLGGAGNDDATIYDEPSSTTANSGKADASLRPSLPPQPPTPPSPSSTGEEKNAKGKNAPRHTLSRRGILWLIVVIVALVTIAAASFIIGQNASATHSEGNSSVFDEEKSLIEDAVTAESIATTGTEEGYDYVDLGLSVNWATCNVGAALPTDYGDYFAWGEIAPKAEYTEENYLVDSENLSDIAGDARYDAAQANWGGAWRLPTKEEIDELIESCTSEWTTIDGVNGMLLTSKINDQTIFFPAAGYAEKQLMTPTGVKGMVYVYDKYGNPHSVHRNHAHLYVESGKYFYENPAAKKETVQTIQKGTSGYYWSSTLNTEMTEDVYVRAAYVLFFQTASIDTSFDTLIWKFATGRTIRPVFEQSFASSLDVAAD